MRWLVRDGLRWEGRTVALAASVFIMGCSSPDPDPTELPPPVPGSICQPDERRCKQGDEWAFEICRADGRGWFEKSCPAESPCDPSTGTCQHEQVGCNPGDAKCTGSPGTAARSLCVDDGSGWNAEPCSGDMVCDPATGGCVAPACLPGESHCDAGLADPDRSVCAADRLSFVSAPCSSDAVCVPTDNASKCVTRVCTPAALSCSSDFTAVLRCDATATSFETLETCDADQACQQGACEASQNPLGEVVSVQGPDGVLALSPGRFAVALVQLDVSGDDMVAYPLTLQGQVRDPASVSASTTTHSPMAAPPVPSAPAMLSRIPELRHGGPAGLPSPFPEDGDERVFHVPDYASGGTTTLARNAVLRASGQHVNLWEDQTTGMPGSLLSDAALADLIERMDTAVIPRTEMLMGDPTDVDENGRVDILFTDVLPGQVAGFSYPSATLFEPGTFAVDYDFGEVIYTHGMTQGQEPREVATLMAHELAQLIYLSRRLTPFLDDPASVPAWVDADLYAVEGLASVPMGWSGQSWTWPAVSALEHPQEMSLWRLMAPSYLQDPDANLASYGFGTLVQEYLFDQAGAVKVQGGGAVLEDAGGLAYVQTFTQQQSGWERLGPLDGRALSSWYVDFATALLLLNLPGEVSTNTAADTRYHFAETVEDAAFGGFIGPTLRYEHVLDDGRTGPILVPRAWSAHPVEMRRGGLGLLAFDVGEGGASLAVTQEMTVAVVIRRAP